MLFNKLLNNMFNCLNLFLNYFIKNQNINLNFVIELIALYTITKNNLY